MSVCFFSSLPNGKHSHFVVLAFFSNNLFSGKTSSPVRNPYLPTVPDDEVEFLALCLSQSY